MPLKKFKLYTDRERNTYYLVYIFRTKEQMRYRALSIDRFHGVDSDSNFMARATKAFPPFNDLDFGCDHWKSKQIGYLFFCLESVSAGVVAHECTHAALYFWMAFIQLDMPWAEIPNNQKADELLADTVGLYVSEFWKNWWKIEKWARREYAR